jgi:protein-disulfide isomerase
MLVTGLAVGVAGLPQTAFALDGDMTIGDAQSSVHLIEYASMTCPHCAHFHRDEFPQLKANYIDSGRIAFTLREYATPPAPVALAMFQLARCGGAGPQLYFERVGELFTEQRAILQTGTGAGVRDALFAIGARWGLSQETIIAAMQDQSGATRITASMEDAHTVGIRGTPSFTLNGQLISGHSYADLAGPVDAALAG